MHDDNYITLFRKSHYADIWICIQPPFYYDDKYMEI